MYSVKSSDTRIDHWSTPAISLQVDLVTFIETEFSVF